MPAACLLVRTLFPQRRRASRRAPENALRATRTRFARPRPAHESHVPTACHSARLFLVRCYDSISFEYLFCADSRGNSQVAAAAGAGCCRAVAHKARISEHCTIVCATSRANLKSIGLTSSNEHLLNAEPAHRQRAPPRQAAWAPGVSLPPATDGEEREAAAQDL